MITNVFLAITEDGFVQSKNTHRFEWLDEDIKDPTETAMIAHSDDEEEGATCTQELFIKKKKVYDNIQMQLLLEKKHNSSLKIQ